MGEEPPTPWPYQQHEETTTEAASLLPIIMAEDELMGAYYIGDVDESLSSNFLPGQDPSCFGGGGGSEDNTPTLKAFSAVGETEGRIASTDPCYEQQQGTNIEDPSRETTVGGAAVTDETKVEEKEALGALSRSDDALPGHCLASSLQETQNENVHVVVDEIEEADKVKAVEGHDDFAGEQQRLLFQPTMTMETADSHALALLDDGSERDSNERHSLTATVNEPLIPDSVDARPAVLDMASSTVDPSFVDVGGGNDEPPRQQAEPVVDDDAAAVTLEVRETPIATTTASGVVEPPTDPTNPSSSMVDNESETMNGVEEDTNDDDDAIGRPTAHHHWPETTLIDTSAPLDCPSHALRNDATEPVNDGTENVGDAMETTHEHRTNHQLDSSSSPAETRAGKENDNETKNAVEEQEEAVNTAETAVETQVMIRNADHDPAGADDDDDGECCTALLSDLVEEADLALEELLGDDFDGAPVVAVPKKTGIVVPAKPKTHRTTGTTKQSGGNTSSSVVRTPMSKVAVRPKQRPVTTSRPFGNKKQSSPQGGEFKARPLPKYLSQGPPKLNLKEFKPTVQVPFRLRTEERFLGRPANCACCIAKRNALLSSLSSHKQHKRSGPSPTDVTEDFATGKAAPIATVIAPDKPTCSPVRPIKLEERFHET